MRKVYLICALFFCITVPVTAQTVATYSFTAFSATYGMLGSGATRASGMLGDDATQRGISLGFTFNYCGTNYTTVSACSNGWLSLTNSSSTAYSNTAANMPYTGTSSGSGVGAGVLMPYWDDLNTSSDTALYLTTGSAPNRVFTLEWRHIHTYSASGRGYFQVKLYETSNIVEFCYGPSSISGSSATIGIANSTTDYQTLSSSGTSPTPSGTTFTTSISSTPANGQVYRWRPCQVTVSAANDGPACPGSTVHFTGTTSGTSYAWRGPAGFTATTATPSIAGITAAQAGVYTLTASDSTCSVSATTAVSLLTAPPAPVISPSVATVCNGGSQMLTAFVPLVTANILNQDFNTGLGTWNVTNTGSSSVQWMVRPDGYTYSSAFHSPDASSFIVATPDAYTGVTTTVLTSPVFSLAGYSTATLTFQHYYRYYSGDYYASVEISTNGGSTWTTINDYRTAATTVGSFTSFAGASFNLAAYLGYTNCKLRFNYSSNWGYYWAIDNILIAGMPTSAPVATWSPAGGLYTDASLTTPYATTTATDTVFEHHTSVATTSSFNYIATVSNGTCTSADTATVTVTNTVPAITGASSVCVGSSTPLTNSATGGTWAVADATVASIDVYGNTMGINPGTTTVYYYVGGCLGFRDITVNPLPAATAGPTTVCERGSTIFLNNSTGGGHWSSNNTTIASVDSSGIVTGVTAGTVNINYTLATGCQTSYSITVDPLPSAITGDLSLCSGGDTSTLHSSPAGGAWASSNPAAAHIGSSGMLTSYGPGATVVTYTLPTGCHIDTTAIVHPLPADITGTTTICQGYGSLLADTTTGGHWSTGNVAIASVNPVTGYVYGLTAGNTSISYTSGANCSVFTRVTVIPVVVPVVTVSVSPGYIVRPGTTVTFTASVTGGGYSPTYQWFINGAVVSGAVSSVYITSSVNNRDSVACQVTNNDVCNGIAGFGWAVMTVGSNVGVTEASMDGSLIISPNPSNGVFLLSGTLSTAVTGQLQLDLMSADGRLVFSRAFEAANGSVHQQITTNIPDGIYLARISNNSFSKIIRVTIQH